MCFTTSKIRVFSGPTMCFWAKNSLIELKLWKNPRMANFCNFNLNFANFEAKIILFWTLKEHCPTKNRKEGMCQWHRCLSSIQWRTAPALWASVSCLVIRVSRIFEGRKILRISSRNFQLYPNAQNLEKSGVLRAPIFEKKHFQSISDMKNKGVQKRGSRGR